ncbi:multidrug efflux MFS transporter EmrD [Endozoicomonas sp. SCSIO W0465]|uniref:multidrug efflux MFS transporter EmrD n=1 Tax=Endozoicomonas sp. SCSIO W0465 TaxID=2918516 RepID=UPI002076552B|nr:multidrug efflux MFS transporter EmrD [Endozoicomonas sp. SCSIO W0465]USE33840.1 multidrug efflux MFS transporter EmrD [Endozoicomonas sp. SCSIO W0465]
MKQQGFFQVLFVIVVLTACGQLTNTIYVPTMSQMAADFGITPGALQAAIAFYLIPYGISQFLYGPLSDRFGRKPLMLIGLLIFIAGSLIGSFAHSFAMLLLASFVQGMGTGVGGVMSRTVMRDLYSGLRLQRANSYISMALIFTPLIAPMLGGFLGAAFGWHASFWFLTGFGVLVWLLVLGRFGETNKKVGKRSMGALASYRYVLGNGQFNGFMISLVATFAGIAVFEAAAGVLFGELMGLDPRVISVLFVLPIPGYLFGSWLAGKMVKKHSLETIIGRGVVMLVIGSVSMLVAGLMGYLNAWVILVPATLYFLGAGLLFPTATTAALEPFPENAGVAGAVLGGMQNLGGGLVTLVAASIPMSSQVPVAAILCSLTLLVAMTARILLAPAAGRAAV